MADKASGGVVWIGTTSYSTDFVLRSSVDGTEMTGKVAADLTGSYWRQGGVRVAITLSDLAAVNSAYSSGGVKEVDGTNMKGTYRLDVPDAAFVTGADWVEVNIFATGSYVFKERFALETSVVTTLAAIKAKTDQLAFTVANKVDSTIQLASDFAQAAADKVWASAARTLSSFGFNVSLATSVWDEVAASHLTAGSTGAKLNSAAAAADPWSAALPGTYIAGQAGFILAGLGGDSAKITAIKAKTDQLTFTTPNVVDASASGGITVGAIAAAILQTALTEGYAADGAAPTLTQFLYMLWSATAEKSISGTAMTTKKVDGSTTAMGFLLNDATNPTSITRTS